ncbi:hypothetical protein M9Y10_035381 [Tritrichomonas musculus]|uniref:Sel1 repeat family protein n=1 Tax=Tritrichomonas musculus TaxID=1915356 RepID=A0ABR2KHL2_9EUKA
MYYYGMMLYEGRGIPMNKKEAGKYLKMAADAGYANAMKDYSYMLSNGDGIPIDKKEAKRYSELVSELKN